MAKSAPEIKLIISNGSNQTHPEILLRKFFAMVFIDTTGKRLDIFIATVFGGVADNKKKMQDGLPFVNYDKDRQKKCFLNFKFQSKILAKSRVKNVTDHFCQQTSEIRRVWCDDDDDYGIREYADEKTVAEKLEELYREFYSPGKASVSLDPVTHPKVYEIKKGASSEHHFMAVPGIYSCSRGDEAEYSLTAPVNVDGLEVINWVRAELDLTESISDRRIHFAIELGQNQTFYTPDFTWYFAPPFGSAVNEDTAALILGKGGKEIPNTLQNVRDDTTGLFPEWVELDIEDRKKARVQLKQLDKWRSSATAFSDVGRIAVSFETFDPQKETNRQFIVGLVVAFVLAFCSDKTRINDFYGCLKEYCQCGETCGCQIFCNWISILAPFVVLLTFCAYAYDPKKCLPSSWKGRRSELWNRLIACRYVAFLSFIVLAIYIFGAWPGVTHFMGGFISCDWNKKIIIGLFLINLISGAWQVRIMKYQLKCSPKY